MGAESGEKALNNRGWTDSGSCDWILRMRVVVPCEVLAPVFWTPCRDSGSSIHFPCNTAKKDPGSSHIRQFNTAGWEVSIKPQKRLRQVSSRGRFGPTHASMRGTLLLNGHNCVPCVGLVDLTNQMVAGSNPVVASPTTRKQAVLSLTSALVGPLCFHPNLLVGRCIAPGVCMLEPQPSG